MASERTLTRLREYSKQWRLKHQDYQHTRHIQEKARKMIAAMSQITAEKTAQALTEQSSAAAEAALTAEQSAQETQARLLVKLAVAEEKERA